MQNHQQSHNSFGVRGKNVPMSIFWLLDNITIPQNMTFRDVSRRLTSVLSPHGALVQFRGYKTNNNNGPPGFQLHNYKHSDLQISGSGCQLQLLDCCKEAIIVDSMSFAYSHIKGATLCFVIDKQEDFKYLLATLHSPQWKTIVITKEVMQTHVICDMKMRWETDILQLYPSITPLLPSTPSVGFEPGDILRLLETDAGGGVSPAASTTATMIDLGIGSDAAYTPTKVPPRSELPSLKNTSTTGASTTSTGVMTKATSKKGVLKEIIVSDSGSTPSISLSKKLPLAIQDVPERVHQKSSILPFVLFIARHLCLKAPSRAFFASTGKWTFLLFRTLADVNMAVKSEPQLKQGTLVDWRRLDPPLLSLSTSSSSQLTKKSTANRPLEIERIVYCCQCNAGSPRLPSEMIQSPNGEQLYYCSEECYGWGSQEKELAVRNVVALLNVIFANDDVSVEERSLRNALYERYFSSNCTSRRLARLWITQAVKSGSICLFSMTGAKKKVACLKSHYSSAKLNTSSDDFDTSQQEQYVQDLLWSNKGWMTHIDMVQGLQARFPISMKSQLSRKQVIINAMSKKLFFVARGPFGHTVGLTLKDAEEALKIAYPSPSPILQLTGPEQKEENKKPLHANTPLVNAHAASTKVTRLDLRVIAPFCPKGLNTIDYKKQD